MQVVGKKVTVGGGTNDQFRISMCLFKTTETEKWIENVHAFSEKRSVKKIIKNAFSFFVLDQV